MLEEVLLHSVAHSANGGFRAKVLSVVPNYTRFQFKKQQVTDNKVVAAHLPCHVIGGGKNSGSEQKDVSECLLTSTQGELYLRESSLFIATIPSGLVCNFLLAIQNLQLAWLSYFMQ